MKLLIIGSKGFIGSHAMTYFTNLGHDVWGCDVIVDYVNAKYVCIDASNSDFSSLFTHNQYDAIINCSGAASVPDSVSNPSRDYSLNTHNVFKLLEAIRKHNPECKFLNLSSAAIYGNPSIIPISESLPASPVSPYGVHKRMAEVICNEFFSFWKIKTCSLRIFSAFGPGLKKQLFWDLYQKSLKGNKVVLLGTGAESRDFIFILDLLLAIDLTIQNAKFEGECINIANGEEITIKDAAFTFYKLFNYTGEVTFENINKDFNPMNWKADISHLKSWGYINKFSFREGLNEYIQWLKKEEEK